MTTASNAVMDAIIPSANAAGADDHGKKIYDTTCVACHAAGVAGAPKLGDKAAWAPRIAQGADTLHTHAIKGFQGKAGMMPPKGGNMSVKDEDVKAAVDYMVSQSKSLYFRIKGGCKVSFYCPFIATLSASLDKFTRV
jgi:cytochrome c5